MTQDFSKIHYKKCRYPSCNLTSRDGVPGLTFHAFPVRQADRCIKWLVNCGLDDWVEMSEKDLKLRYICCRHFSEDNFYATGRLKREAVPIILGLENPSLKANKNVCKMRKIVSTETDSLKKQIEKLEIKLEKERLKKAEIRAKLCATRVALSRLKAKLTEGTFQDIYLNKSLANRLQGFVLTFIRMQLFHKQSTCYTTDEQRLCMMMHCISPALYSKMRDDFKFVLPNEITMIRWFNKLNISPKKANLLGSFNFEKIEQIMKKKHQNKLSITQGKNGLQNETEGIFGLSRFLESAEHESAKEDKSSSNEGQIEILEEEPKEEFINKHFKVLKSEVQRSGATYQKIKQPEVSIIEVNDDLKYVSTNYCVSRNKKKRFLLSYVREREDIQSLTEVLSLQSKDDVGEYKITKDINNDFDSSQYVEKSEEYLM